MSEYAEQNKAFNDQAYKSRASVIGLLHTMVSYDQQSKSKRNITQLEQQVKMPAHGQTMPVLDFGFGHGALLLKFPRNC